MGLVADYKQMFQKLLPQGEAWNREEGSVLSKLLETFAEEFARIHQRGLDLIEESDPRTTTELIDEWEHSLGLPDPCIGSVSTLKERREQVRAKLVTMRGQGRVDYFDLADSLGFDVGISEPSPFRSGQSSSGEPIYNQNWRHWWVVDTPYTIGQFFESGKSKSGDSLSFFDNRVITCAFNKRKQAQTKILFRFPEEA